MKSAQWVAVLCVSACIVFGLTFLANYLGGRGGHGKGNRAVAGPQAELTWADNVTDFPADPSHGPAECEIGHPQSHDFWFKNENTQTLPIGVLSKTCQCTSVQLWFAQAKTETPAAADREKAAKELEEAGPAVELKDKEGGVDVPAGAVGMVRLSWPGGKAGPKDLAAELWMGEKGPGLVRRFTIRTVFVGPLRVGPRTPDGKGQPLDIDFGDLPLEKLPYQRTFKCWSPTRSAFPLTAGVIQNKATEESDAFTVSDPTPLTEAELADLRKNPANGAVLAGYKVTATLNRASKDKRAADVGIFRRHVELRTVDADPIEGVVHGTVLGDLAVVGADPGPVKFDKFDRTQPKRVAVLVDSGADVTALEVDKTRTADYLAVEVAGEPEKNGDRKTWRLKVKWLPDVRASGEFPRDEDEYRDSAVYIRPVYAKAGGSPSCLRIPVVGNAETPP